MRGMLRPKGRAVWLFVFATLAVSCSRPAGPRPQDSTQTDAGQVPFQNAANAPSDASRLSPVDPNKGSKAESALPFRDSQDLPAGTLVTVRLKEPISSDYPGERLTFGAVVDEPVQVDGNTLLARGASVAGRVGPAVALKLDIEGTELEVLRGGRDFIRSLQRVVICLEFHRKVLARIGRTDVEILAEIAEFRKLRWVDADDPSRVIDPRRSVWEQTNTSHQCDLIGFEDG